MKDLIEFLVSKRKFWLMPVVFVLIMMGFLIVYVGSTALSPFIYTLF
jgi:hypothetical protein